MDDTLKDDLKAHVIPMIFDEGKNYPLLFSSNSGHHKKQCYEIINTDSRTQIPNGTFSHRIISIFISSDLCPLTSDFGVSYMTLNHKYILVPTGS